MACPLQVAVRIRPPQPHDGKAGEPAVEAIDSIKVQAAEGSESKQFAFDRVFGPVTWLGLKSLIQLLPVVLLSYGGRKLAGAEMQLTLRKLRNMRYWAQPCSICTRIAAVLELMP